LYEKDAETNLLNFVDFLSEEDVNVERDIPLDGAKLVGLGSTMEVYSTIWKGQQVAVKRMRRDKMPTRSANLAYEHDAAFAQATREFYGDVKCMMQEILVMSRVSET
jgi:predicted Ser/Thr protein kinase